MATNTTTDSTELHPARTLRTIADAMPLVNDTERPFGELPYARLETPDGRFRFHIYTTGDHYRVYLNAVLGDGVAAKDTPRLTAGRADSDAELKQKAEDYYNNRELFRASTLDDLPDEYDSFKELGMECDAKAQSFFD